MATKVYHKGRVVDEQGNSLWGAHIITLNSNPKRASTTDVNGNFMVDGYIGEGWQITYLGFKPQNFTLKAVNIDKTYRMIESVEQLDEVVLTPRTNTPTKTKNPFDISGLLNDISSIFTGATKNIATPPVLPNNGITTSGMAQNVYVKPVNDTRGLKQWINDNKMFAGTLAALAIVGTGMAISSNKNKSKTPKSKSKTKK